MLTYPPVKKVSVVIPVYNEQDSLPELLRRTDAACATLGRQYEILLIDDGSSDDSARMLTEAAEAEGSHVVAVLLNRNYGQHSAIMAGFSHVTGDLIITLDADLQNPPEEIRGWWRRLMKVTTWWALSARTVRTASSVKPRRR
ncbi:Polymyxin resistance protein ArnC [Klebsiella pneumoniae]|nr:Polymyxin resistance protein ArnC [Klebsiella pneumoniae]